MGRRSRALFSLLLARERNTGEGRDTERRNDDGQKRAKDVLTARKISRAKDPTDRFRSFACERSSVRRARISSAIFFFLH